MCVQGFAFSATFLKYAVNCVLNNALTGYNVVQVSQSCLVSGLANAEDFAIIGSSREAIYLVLLRINQEPKGKHTESNDLALRTYPRECNAHYHRRRRLGNN